MNTRPVSKNTSTERGRLTGIRTHEPSLLSAKDRFVRTSLRRIRRASVAKNGKLLVTVLSAALVGGIIWLAYPIHPMTIPHNEAIVVRALRQIASTNSERLRTSGGYA